MTADAKPHQPLRQYVLSVASTLTVAVLVWIGNTANNTLIEISKLSGVVTGINREVDRQDNRLTELEQSVGRLLRQVPESAQQ